MAKDQEHLDKLRHSAAHLLAAAVLELYPKAKLAIGPAIENGFYYDIDFGEAKISEDDLPKIEKTMHALVKDWTSFERQTETAAKLKKQFKGNPYKIELIEEFAKEGQKLTTYKSGDFIDLCRGGHVEHPASDLKYFKLLSVAGAYWQGSEKNPMLTRIYGTAWPSQKELDDYLHQQEEAKKRDHKKLGRELDLFAFSELVGPGLPLWTPKGTILRNLLDNFVWELRRARGYQKVEIPHITKKDLYVTSGHWDKFKDDLFQIKSREGYDSAIKPMNCPHHTQIFDRKPHSYKEMPQRYANTTMVYRDEQTGELSGLSRVEAITQDDAHVFCRQSQVKDEFNAVWDIADEFYQSMGFKLEVRLSLHDPENFQKYLGKQEDWKIAENKLRQLAKDRKVSVFEAPGEAAFYGPKIDFMAQDSLGRQWQVATIQLDMNMPERFDLVCTNEKGEKERVVMIHAAIMGSIERFMSIIIEHFAGAFPVWLSPVQVKILPITERNLQYAQEISNKLQEAGVRTEVDDRNETLQAKIRDAQMTKVPYMAIVGDKEEKAQKVAVRLRTEKDLGQMSLDKFIGTLKDKIETKALDLI